MNEQRRPWLRASNFGEVCAETLRSDPDRLAMFADGREFSYAQLDERARRFALRPARA